MRLLPISLLLVLISLLLSPFLLTAWLRDHRGLNITGTVTRKQETVWHSTFENDITRSAMVTVSYFPPGRSWPAYQSFNLPLARYDEVNRGDVLRMRYLLERDLPDYPLLHSLYRSGFLPVASVDGRSVFRIWQDLVPELPLQLLGGAAVLIFLLWLWYKLRIPGAVFAVAAGVLGAIGFTMFSGIPQPLPTPQHAVLSGRAVVQNEWSVSELFSGPRARTPWSLPQPVQYVALEFVPEGRREPVVAADNIDLGSIPGLKHGQLLDVQYERANPRKASLVLGTRTFWNKNLRGLAITAFAWIVAGVVALLFWIVVSRKRSTSSKAMPCA